MPNKKLEKNQRKAYKEDRGDYTFQCKTSSCDSVHSPVMRVKKPGIYLHFLRYGLFSKHANASEETHVEDLDYAKYQNNKRAVLLKNDNFKQYFICHKDAKGDPLIKLDECVVEDEFKDAGLPKVSNFYTARTALRAGFVYLMNDEDPNDYYELEVDENGFLSHILWQYNKDEKGNYKDVRHSTKEKITAKLVKPGKKLWVAYSSIQWSRDYHHEINTNAKKRKQRMTLIDCTGFKKGESSKNSALVPFNEVSAVFHNKHIYSHTLESNLYQIHADEKYQDKKGKNDILEDMFITLHDPIGCAEDVFNELEDEIQKHEASLESMRFGENPKSVINRMNTGKQKNKLSKRDEGLSNMFSTALTTYQLVYNDPEAIKKYNGGMEGSGFKFLGFIGITPMITYDQRGLLGWKLSTILGVSQRRKQRYLIRMLQKDLAGILKSNYFDSELIDFYDGSSLCNMLGKYELTKYLSLLALNPHDIDRSLDLKKHQEKNYHWNDFIEKSILCAKPQTNLEKVLEKKVDIDDKAQIDATEMTVNLANKAAGFADRLIGSIAKITTKKEVTELIESTMEMVVKRLNRLTAYGVEMYELREYEIFEQLPEKTDFNFKDGDEGKYRGKKKVKRFKVKSPNIKLKHSRHGKHVFDMPIVTENTKVVDAPTKLAQKAKKIVDSNSFRGTVALLQVFNLGVASKALINDMSSVKNQINFAGVSAELSEAILTLRHTQLEKRGVKITRFGKATLRGTSIIGASVTVIMCAWDAYDHFASRDTDAAWAYVGAGAAFSGVTVATIFASASWAGPLGWICAGVGLGFVTLAYFLKDSPIEKYFKHCVFSDAKDLPLKEDESIWKYNNRFYDNRTIMLGNNNSMKHLANFKIAAAELHDLIVCSKIEILINKLAEKERQTYAVSSGIGMPISQTITSGKVKDITVKVSFNQFLQKPEQFHYEVYYYKNGMNSNEKPKPLEYKQPVTIENTEKNAPPKAVVNFSISHNIIKNITQKSCILFVCRLKLHGKGYYPVDYQNNERSLGAIIGLKSTKSSAIYTTDLTYREHTCIAPKAQLLDYSAWKNKK